MARILVIEDDGDLLFVLSELLRTAGHDVAGFDTGEDGLEAATSELPDLALLDLDLHGSAFDGCETMRRIRALPGGSTLPIIAVSASISRRGGKSSQVEGFSASVSKPYVFEELSETMDRFLVH